MFPCIAQRELALSIAQRLGRHQFGSLANTSRHTNPRYPTRPKDIHLENLERELSRRKRLTRAALDPTRPKDFSSRRVGGGLLC